MGPRGLRIGFLLAVAVHAQTFRHRETLQGCLGFTDTYYGPLATGHCAERAEAFHRDWDAVHVHSTVQTESSTETPVCVHIRVSAAPSLASHHFAAGVSVLPPAPLTTSSTRLLPFLPFLISLPVHSTLRHLLVVFHRSGTRCPLRSLLSFLTSQGGHSHHVSRRPASPWVADLPCFNLHMLIPSILYPRCVQSQSISGPRSRG